MIPTEESVDISAESDEAAAEETLAVKINSSRMVELANNRRNSSHAKLESLKP